MFYVIKVWFINIAKPKKKHLLHNLCEHAWILEPFYIAGCCCFQKNCNFFFLQDYMQNVTGIEWEKINMPVYSVYYDDTTSDPILDNIKSISIMNIVYECI
jgi:hypothetical protein